MSKARTQQPIKAQHFDNLRFPDLSRDDDLKNPLHRLAGITNYCQFLTGYYQSVADALEIARREYHRINATRLKSGRPDKPTRDEMPQWELIKTWEKSCEECYTKLRQLCDAAMPLMPEVSVKLKVLRLGAKPLHCDRQADWQGFEDDLAAIYTQARVLYAKAEGSLAEAITPKPMVRLIINSAGNVATFDGEPISISADQGRCLKLLLDARGFWVSSKKMKIDPNGSERPDRTINALPAKLRDIVGSETGKGYRLSIFNYDVCQLE